MRLFRQGEQTTLRGTLLSLTDTRHPFPWPVDQDWAIIAHLPVVEALEGTATCRLVLCDIAEGREAIEQMVIPMTRWQKRTDLLGLAHPDEPQIVIDVNADRSTNDSVTSEVSRKGLHAMNGERRVILAMDSNNDPDGTAWAQRPGSPAMRRFLTSRIQNLAEHPDALALFVARMEASGVPRLSKCDTHTNRELRRIEAEIVKVECQFGIDKYNVTIPPLDEPPAEGRDLTPDETRQLAATYKAVDQTKRIAVDVWANEALQAGLEVHMSTRQTERRRANLLARIACADPELEPEFVRAAIAHVTREDWPHLPTIPLGACFGALTIDEASRLAAMAPTLQTSTYSRDGSGALQYAA